MSQNQERQISVTVVVSGQSERVRVNSNQKLEHLVKEALRETGNQGQGPSDWELRLENGTLLDQQQRAGEAGVVDGMTLFLSPKAGAGGE